MSAEPDVYKATHPIRMVTATSLFDGHDASINIFRRILQSTGVEVIHLGHNRSVGEIVDAAIEEDVQGIAVSSYQGGHVEFFKYMVDLLRERGAAHIRVFGGGGGVIVPGEIRELEAYGVAKIYSPADGARMGLQGIVNHLVESIDFSTVAGYAPDPGGLGPDDKLAVARLVSCVELARAGRGGEAARLKAELEKKTAGRRVPVLGITGTGGAGKSSLTDELILRLLHDNPEARVGILSSDPSRRKTGGALLGDRIRMNTLGNPRIYMRSLATRRSQTEIPEALDDCILALKASGFDLIIAETAGIGQGDSRITDLVDVSLYVMTSEFGAATQLEKIDMLDFADLVAVNKYEKRGGEDAVRDVRKQVQRNRESWDTPAEEMPVFGTIASKFNDDGVTSLYHALIDTIADKTGRRFTSQLPRSGSRVSTSKTIIIPPERVRYLAEIADTVRSYHRLTQIQADGVRRVWHLEEAAGAVGEGAPAEALAAEAARAREALDRETVRILEGWDRIGDRQTRSFDSCL